MLEPCKEAVEEAHLSSLVLLRSPSRALDPTALGPGLGVQIIQRDGLPGPRPHGGGVRLPRCIPSRSRGN